MALYNQTDPEQAARQLASCLANRLPGASDVNVTDVEIPSASGMSTETILFTASYRQDGEKRECQAHRAASHVRSSSNGGYYSSFTP